ncbi:hypothetical protein ILYODFUR_007229 [Ilyodon furcidens]|uniref:Uncharacterized protein n=1 Tax=Ilyodon furcidens TaxID=33524 RepID=A0ABV0UEI4_9TELE
MPVGFVEVKKKSRGRQVQQKPAKDPFIGFQRAEPWEHIKPPQLWPLRTYFGQYTVKTLGLIEACFLSLSQYIVYLLEVSSFCALSGSLGNTTCSFKD